MSSVRCMAYLTFLLRKNVLLSLKGTHPFGPIARDAHEPKPRNFVFL